MYKNSLKELEIKREKYSLVEWKSSSNKEGGAKLTLITEMEDSYLLNVLKIVYEKLQLSNAYPFIEEYKSYCDISYINWEAILINEYKYREALLDLEYNDYLELEIQRQMIEESNYYK